MNCTKKIHSKTAFYSAPPTPVKTPLQKPTNPGINPHHVCKAVCWSPLSKIAENDLRPEKWFSLSNTAHALCVKEQFINSCRVVSPFSWNTSLLIGSWHYLVLEFNVHKLEQHHNFKKRKTTTKSTFPFKASTLWLIPSHNC